MYCRIDEMRQKQVVEMNTGAVVGFVSDIEFDTQNGYLTSIVIFGKPKALGFLGKEDDIVIPWNDIKVIGEETVLVRSDNLTVKNC